MPQNLLTRRQLVAKIKRCPAQIDADVRAGKLPAPIQTGLRSIAWIEAEIDEWIASRPRVAWAPAIVDEPEASPIDTGVTGIGHNQPPEPLEAA